MPFPAPPHGSDAIATLVGLGLVCSVTLAAASLHPRMLERTRVLAGFSALHEVTDAAQAYYESDYSTLSCWAGLIKYTRCIPNTSPAPEAYGHPVPFRPDNPKVRAVVVSDYEGCELTASPARPPGPLFTVRVELPHSNAGPPRWLEWDVHLRRSGATHRGLIRWSARTE